MEEPISNGLPSIGGSVCFSMALAVFESVRNSLPPDYRRAFTRAIIDSDITLEFVVGESSTTLRSLTSGGMPMMLARAVYNIMPSWNQLDDDERLWIQHWLLILDNDRPSVEGRQPLLSSNPEVNPPEREHRIESFNHEMQNFDFDSHFEEHRPWSQLTEDAAWPGKRI